MVLKKADLFILILKELILCLGFRAAFWQAVFGTPFNAVIDQEVVGVVLEVEVVQSSGL